MSRKGKKIYMVVTAFFVVATLVLAIYIMIKGLGLAPDLDFGAGAYYYADIPEFEKYVGDGAYKSRLPLWAAIVIFLAWGFLMWKLWKWVDRRGQTGEKKQKEADEENEETEETGEKEQKED